MKLAISTCWNSHRHIDGYEMMVELARMGFEWVELSHGIRVSLVPGILQALDEGIARISSVHNFCPLPPGVLGAAPNLYQPSSPLASEREQWFRTTLKTIDFANRVGADLMVSHSGSIRYFFARPAKKFDAARDGKRLADLPADAPARRLMQKLLKRLGKDHRKFRARTIECYQRIEPFLREKGVRMAVENRESYFELPLDADMADFLKELPAADYFGYWHDTGHAALKEFAGLIDSACDLLKANRDRQYGFHLHDITAEEKDHYPPGEGIIDWDALAAYFRRDDLYVMEMSPRLRSEQILRGKAFVEQLIQSHASA